MIEDPKILELGASVYRGIRVLQTPAAFKFIEHLIRKESIELIVECGTFTGGLSLYLSDKNLCEIHTFDIKDHTENYPVKANLHRYIKDFHSKECMEFVKDLSKNKKTLWLIDGGDKKKEVLLYTDIFKSNDVVMSHDFAPNDDSFSYLRDNRIWLWHESDSSVFPVEKFKEYEDFDSIWKLCVWGCYIKK